MSSKGKRGRCVSNYDECSVHLLSAFFCLCGATREEDRLRKAIEAVLVQLSAAQSAAGRSNVVKFGRRPPLAG